MERLLLWIGALLCAAGLGLIVANLGLHMMGLGASYNLGDPTKFEFILVPFWAIGLGVAAFGGLCLVFWRRVRRTPQ
jgi:hypothetical protein